MLDRRPVTVDRSVAFADPAEAAIKRAVAPVDKFRAAVGKRFVASNTFVVTVDEIVVRVDDRSVGGERRFAVVDGVRAGRPTCRPFGTGAVIQNP